MSSRKSNANQVLFLVYFSSNRPVNGFIFVALNALFLQDSGYIINLDQRLTSFAEFRGVWWLFLKI